MKMKIWYYIERRRRLGTQNSIANTCNKTRSWNLFYWAVSEYRYTPKITDTYKSWIFFEFFSTILYFYPNTHAEGQP